MAKDTSPATTMVVFMDMGVCLYSVEEYGGWRLGRLDMESDRMMGTNSVGKFCGCGSKEEARTGKKENGNGAKKRSWRFETTFASVTCARFGLGLAEI